MHYEILASVIEGEMVSSLCAEEVDEMNLQEHLNDDLDDQYRLKDSIKMDLKEVERVNANWIRINEGVVQQPAVMNMVIKNRVL